MSKDVLRSRAMGDGISQFVKIPMHGHPELFHGKRKFEHEPGIVIHGHDHSRRSGGGRSLRMPLGLVRITYARYHAMHGP